MSETREQFLERALEQARRDIKTAEGALDELMKVGEEFGWNVPGETRFLPAFMREALQKAYRSPLCTFAMADTEAMAITHVCRLPLGHDGGHDIQEVGLSAPARSEAAKYRAALGRLDEAASRMPSAAKRHVREVLEWLLSLEVEDKP